MQKSVFRWYCGRLTVCERGGLVGLGLSGNVPLQAVVSRGVVPSSPLLELTRWEYEKTRGIIKGLAFQHVVPGAPAAAGQLSAMQVFGSYGSDESYIGVLSSPGQEGSKEQEGQLKGEGGKCVAPLPSPTTTTMVMRDYFFSDVSRSRPWAQPAGHSISASVCVCLTGPLHPLTTGRGDGEWRAAVLRPRAQWPSRPPLLREDHRGL